MIRICVGPFDGNCQNMGCLAEYLADTTGESAFSALFSGTYVRSPGPFYGSEI